MSVTRITADQLVARKGGWTTYIKSDGTKVKARNSQVEVVDESESARSPAPKASKPAKPAPKLDDDGNPIIKLRRVGDSKHDCSHYVKATSAGGNKSLDNGDELAAKLRGMELDAVYTMAAKLLKEAEESLKRKYRSLNPGMQRMNLGNRMRAAMRANTKATA